MGSRRFLLTFLVGGLLFVGVGFYWYGGTGSEDSASVETGEVAEEEQVKHEFTKFQLVETTSESEVWKLTAPYSKQSGDTLDLKQPHLVLRQSGDTTAVITSQTGQYRMDRGTLRLVGDVVIHRPAYEQTLKTEVLNWDRTEGTIETDKTVIIESPRGRLRAVGMWADLAAERMKFQSNVQFLSGS